MKVLALAAFFAVAYAQQEQLPACTAATCESSHACIIKGKEAMHNKVKGCFETCKQQSGITGCAGGASSGKEAFKQCMDSAICSASNIEAASSGPNFGPMMGGKFGEGKGKGKGKLCDHLKSKMQHVATQIGNEKAATFTKCVTDCACSGGDPEPSCKPTCDVHKLAFPAMMGCKEKVPKPSGEGGKKQKCECVVKALGGDTAICAEHGHHGPNRVRRMVNDMDEF